MMFNPIALGDSYGTLDKYFGNTLASMGYGGPIMSQNQAAMSGMGAEGGADMSATMLNPAFADWARQNNISTSLMKGDDYNIMRLMQGDNVVGERKYQTKDGLDKFAEVAGPIALAIGTGGVLGQALGFLNPALNPLDPSTWSGAFNTGGGAAGGGGSSMTANPAWLEQALAGDFAASQAAAMNSLGAGAGLTAGELAAIGGAGLGAAGGAAGAAAGASGATSAAGGLTGLLKDAAPYLKTALPIAGAVAGSKPSGGGSQTTQSKTDPRLDPYLYGDQGILKQAQKWFQANQQPNQAMQQGWQMQMGLLGDPAIQQQMGQLRSSAMGLLGGPIAGNGFARFYGG